VSGLNPTIGHGDFQPRIGLNAGFASVYPQAEQKMRRKSASI
jgi:hypothetical protein